MAIGDERAALRALIAAALAMPATPAELAFSAGVDAAEAGQTRAAVRALLRARRLGAPHATVAIGLVARDTGRPRAAMLLLRLANVRDEPRAAVALSGILCLTGRSRQAERVLASGAECDAEAQRALMAARWQSGDLAGAMQAQRRALELGWPSEDWDAATSPPHPHVRLAELLP